MSAILMMEMVDEAFRFINSDRGIELAKQYAGSPAFIEDFRTIAIRCPRQFGHSTTSGNLLAKYPNSVLVVPKRAMIEQYAPILSREMIETRVMYGSGFGDIQHQTDKLRGTKRPLDLVIFDPVQSFNWPAVVNPIRMMKYDLFVPLGVKMFVELG